MVSGSKYKGQLLVLDIDGVMIDPAGSFETCSAMALKELAPDLAWSNEMYWELKRIPGFNNDFRLTAAALALFESGEIDRLSEALNKGFPHLEKRMDELEPRCKEVMQFYYQDLKRLERPLITLAELEAIVDWDTAILTGRPPDEMPLAFDVLGFEIPAICDSCPEFRKPEPGGLLHLADIYSANRVYFVGDTRDAAPCLRRARAARPALD
ncbi:MAG: HAD family hydrolase, partial [Holophagales bacterium]|nr:HAD family hydrolase [Holophagales bacterium]